MSTGEFFEDPREQSLVKAAIVSKYFWAWANVLMPTVRRSSQQHIAYIDLFAGPGRYLDGTLSTPLRVLEQAAGDENLRERLIAIFNDKDERNARSLEEAIKSVPEIHLLRIPPKVFNYEVGDEIVKQFEKMRFVPTLFFVDPWGYKGLSLRLVNSVLKDWGCDCIFFFNYNRINMGLNNQAVREHMDALFGTRKAERLASQLAGMSPSERELTIVEELSQVLKGPEGRYVLPFRFGMCQGR